MSIHSSEPEGKLDLHFTNQDLIDVNGTAAK